MNFDRSLFADKLSRYCKQLSVTIKDISERTGIALKRLNELKEQKADPTGDEILIIADFFKCDYKFFISNERLTAFEQTEQLFRKYSDSLTKEDKWSIQEFLFLCECEQFLFECLKKQKQSPFHFQPTGNFYKQHGKDAAILLRKHLNYSEIANPRSLNLFEDFARMGIHIFRRKINGTISGLCIHHPIVGRCILINYNEDLYRQRFSIAHEIAHAIFDLEKDQFSISFSKWDKNNLIEIRANSFASEFLIPSGFIKKIQINKWNETNIIEWSKKLMVNVMPFTIALKENGLIDESDYRRFKELKIVSIEKRDPEIPDKMSQKNKERISELLERGLSNLYVKYCFEAYSEGCISVGRLSEMLLIQETEISDIATLFGRALDYDA